MVEIVHKHVSNCQMPIGRRIRPFILDHQLNLWQKVYKLYLEGQFSVNLIISCLITIKVQFECIYIQHLFIFI